jgi:hypothetical protein
MRLARHVVELATRTWPQQRTANFPDLVPGYAGRRARQPRCRTQIVHTAPYVNRTWMLKRPLTIVTSSGPLP